MGPPCPGAVLGTVVCCGLVSPPSSLPRSVLFSWDSALGTFLLPNGLKFILLIDGEQPAREAEIRIVPLIMGCILQRRPEPGDHSGRAPEDHPEWHPDPAGPGDPDAWQGRAGVTWSTDQWSRRRCWPMLDQIWKPCSFGWDVGSGGLLPDVSFQVVRGQGCHPLCWGSCVPRHQVQCTWVAMVLPIAAL